MSHEPPAVSSSERSAIKFLHAGDDRVWCVGCKRFAWCDGDDGCPKDDAAECPIQHEPDDVVAPSLADAQEALDALAKECRDLDDSLLAAPRSSGEGAPADDMVGELISALEDDIARGDMPNIRRTLTALKSAHQRSRLARPSLEEPAPTVSGWNDAASAPRDGSHILATQLGKRGFGICGGEWQDWCAVVHYWSNPGEEGFYLSSGNSDDAVTFTHWMPLAAPTVSQEAPGGIPSDAGAALAWLEREGHSLMFYGSGIWSVDGDRRQRTPLDAINVARFGACLDATVGPPDETIAVDAVSASGGPVFEGLVHCRRAHGHDGDHWGYVTGSETMTWPNDNGAGGIPRTDSEEPKRDTWARQHFPNGGVDLRSSALLPAGLYRIQPGTNAAPLMKCVGEAHYLNGIDTRCECGAKGSEEGKR